jgi:uncharacterized protein YcaQ
VRVEGWREPAYLADGAPALQRVEAAALVSPFDPLIWTRPRTERLFGFDYRLKIYVPAPRRRWGYYVLPFLLGERLVARVDLRADRDGQRLLVLAAYGEKGIDREETANALALDLATMAEWLGVGAVSVARKGDLARVLAGYTRR